MLNIKLILLIVAFIPLLGYKQPALAQHDPLQYIQNPKTLNESYISDPDHLFSPSTIADLNLKLKLLDQAGIAHIDVVFVNSIGDRVPKEIAHTLFRKWKIGDQKKNNGMLILMVKDQRRVEFETGYGLEGQLPDVFCYRIQREYIIPYAKKGNYDLAIISGVDAVIRQLKTEEYISAPTTDNQDTVGGAKLSITEPQITNPIIAAPRSDYVEVADTTVKSSKTMGGWPSLIILILYILAVLKISGDIKTDGRIKLSDPLLWFMLLIPVGSIVFLDHIYPVSWIEIRQVVLLYFFLTVLILMYYLILSRKLTRSLKGLSSHEQYIKWYDTHARIEWAAKVFPVFNLYWLKYQKRLKVLRDQPLICDICNIKMSRLSEVQDDYYLSQGQLTEERIESIDYDVWECKDCKKKVVLDYRNIKSRANTCPNCDHRTLIYQEKVIIESATTTSEGRGYKVSVCKNCDFHHKEEFSIARISTSSGSTSWSSTSSSSSSSSTSSGGSSGGGGAGSSW